MSQAVAKVPARSRSDSKNSAATSHGGGLVRIDREGMSGDVFGFFPYAQKDIGLREASLDIWISRILLDRFFQLVQSAIPFALPAMHKSDKLERQRVVRLKLEGALKLG